MTKQQAIQFFEQKQVRTVWDRGSDTFLHMLIDKQGKIVNADAPVPENEELVTAIKKLLTK